MNIYKFQKLSNENPFCPINDVVYQYLSQEIITVRMAPGDSINVSNLAKTLEISRSPIQNALERLQNEGLVEKSAGKLLHVSSVTYEEYAQLIQFRRVIESEAAYYAAKKITVDALEKLRSLLSQSISHADSWRKLCDIDQQFHQIIILSADNKYFKLAYESYKNMLLRYRYYVLSRGLQQDINFKDLHTGLYHALKNRLSDQAKCEMLYIVNSMNKVIRFF